MEPPDESPADIPSLFSAERSRLLALLRSLSAADWSRPTPCPDWTALDLSAHLVGVDLGSLARRRDGHEVDPPAGVDSEERFVEWLDSFQMEWVRGAARLSPTLVVDLLEWSGPQIVEMFRAQDPSDRTASVSWTGNRPVPVWLDQARELSEYWIHRSQLLDALRRPVTLDPPTVGVILEAFRWAYPWRLGESGAAVGDTVTIEISGPVVANWSLVSTDRGWVFSDVPGARLAGRINMTTDQAWRLLSNNLPAATLRSLDTSGDPEVVEILLRTRAIIGSPS